MTARPAKKILVDSVMNGLLDQLRRGHVRAAGMLAEYMDDMAHPQAKPIRRIWNQWYEAVRYWWLTPNRPRNRKAPWFRCAQWHGWLMFKVSRFFSRKWRRPAARWRYTGIDGELQWLHDTNCDFVRQLFPAPVTSEVTNADDETEDQ